MKVKKEYGLKCLSREPDKAEYAAIVLAVGHTKFVSMGERGIKALGLPNAVIYDVKGVLPYTAVDGRL